MKNYIYFEYATHFWEYQITDVDNDTMKWERYDPSIQAIIHHELKNNDELAALKIGDTDFEIFFDHENGDHCQRDVNNGLKNVVRKTPEKIVKDWNVFKEMTCVSKITKLHLGVGGYGETPKINDHDAHGFIKRLVDCTSLWYLDLIHNKLTDAFGVALGKRWQKTLQ